MRAIDASNNVDPSPAGYSFVIALTAAPPPGSGVSPGANRAPRQNGRAQDEDRETGRENAGSHAHLPLQLEQGRGASFQCKLDGGHSRPATLR